MPKRIPDEQRICNVCGDRESIEYYHSVENHNNILCRKHYQNESYSLGYYKKRRATALQYHHSHKHNDNYIRVRQVYRESHSEERKNNHHVWYILNRQNIRKDRLLQRLQLIDLLSFGRFSCAYCSYDTDFRALEIDHKNSDGCNDRKRFSNQNHMISYYLSNMEEAFNKLQILCSNCNRIKRHEMHEWGDVDEYVARRERNRKTIIK